MVVPSSDGVSTQGYGGRRGEIGVIAPLTLQPENTQGLGCSAGV